MKRLLCVCGGELQFIKEIDSFVVQHRMKQMKYLNLFRPTGQNVHSHWRLCRHLSTLPNSIGWKQTIQAVSAGNKDPINF